MMVFVVNDDFTRLFNKAEIKKKTNNFSLIKEKHQLVSFAPAWGNFTP